MSHDHHENLPHYHPDQLLHDGCGECERRGKDPYSALLHLDVQRFRRAWLRACEWQRDGKSGNLSLAECDLLRLLWAVQVQLNRIGVPLGVVPDELSLLSEASTEIIRRVQARALRDACTTMTPEQGHLPRVYLASRADEIEQGHPGCEHGVLPADACAICNPDEVT